MAVARLEANVFSVNKVFINACVTYVIRNDKRFNRYQMNMTKDINRIKFLLKRSWRHFPLVRMEIQKTFGLSGWKDINLSDLKAPASADYAEVIAIMEYWDLWDFSNEVLALVPSKR